MSKPRYKWWGFMKSVIRAYPEHRADLADSKTQSITAAYNSMPHGSGVSKPIETLALKELPKEEQRELVAVEGAINMTKRFSDGQERLKLIDMVFWSKTHTLQGAAIACNVSYGTAKRWHNKFIELTARNYGIL